MNIKIGTVRESTSVRGAVAGGDRSLKSISIGELFENRDKAAVIAAKTLLECAKSLKSFESSSLSRLSQLSSDSEGVIRILKIDPK